MTEYTPEKVAELVAEARDYIKNNDGSHGSAPSLVAGLADALTAVSANRDEFRTAWNAQGFENIRLEDERDALQAELRQEREAKAAWKDVADANALKAGRHEGELAQVRKMPFVSVGFEGGTTLALTGENAGNWVEGTPTHVPYGDLASPVIRRIQAEARASAIDDAAKVLARRSVAFFHIEAVRALGETA